ncbi:MAG: Uma2 family endonuclease [Cytophagales bacterium]|nr:MAG: Uma2 family endonuclease [Cytophagales bacterium]
MNTTIESTKTKIKKKYRTPSRVLRAKPDYLSLEKFISLDIEGKETKYEWKSGKVILEYKMKKEERIIINNIIKKYYFSEKAIKDESCIMAEADVELSSVDTYRRPDAAYFTREQIIHPNIEPVAPYFVIEVNSHSNTFDSFETKLEDYFKAGVQCVWQIMPNTKKVYIYKSPTEVSIKSKNEICFANLENNNTFAMNVNEIFENFGL